MVAYLHNLERSRVKSGDYWHVTQAAFYVPLGASKIHIESKICISNMGIAVMTTWLRLKGQILSFNRFWSRD